MSTVVVTVTVKGFSPPVTNLRPQNNPHSSSSSQSRSPSLLLRPWLLRLHISEPSDTSSDSFSDYYEYVDVESSSSSSSSSENEETAATSLVQNVLNLMPPHPRMNPIEEQAEGEGESKRAAINEALYKLEALQQVQQMQIQPHSTTSSSRSNTTGSAASQVTLSPLLNGVWQLRYLGGSNSMSSLITSVFLTGVGSNNNNAVLADALGGAWVASTSISQWLLPVLPPLVELSDNEPVEVVIMRSQPRVETSVKIKSLLGLELIVRFTCRLHVESDVRLRETYEHVAVFLSSSSSSSSSGSSSSSSSSSDANINTNTNPIWQQRLLPDNYDKDSNDDYFDDYNKNNNKNSPFANVFQPLRSRQRRILPSTPLARDLYVTYLDEDMLIVRDVHGAPQVLTRKDYQPYFKGRMTFD